MLLGLGDQQEQWERRALRAAYLRLAAMFCLRLFMGTLAAVAVLAVQTTLARAALRDWLVLVGRVLLFLDRQARMVVLRLVTRKIVEMAV